MKSHSIVLLAFAVTALLACTSSGANGDLQLPDNVDCNGTPPAYADVTAFTKCTTCHASTKTGAQRANAPADVNFDTEAAADAHAEEAASEVNKGDMPPRGSGVTLTDSEKQQLYAWALCRM
jgi:uncharacterized membrane protein